MDLFCVCLSSSSVMSVYCSLAVTCLEKADLLALLCVMFSFAFVTFPRTDRCGTLLYRFLIFAFSFTL